MIDTNLRQRKINQILFLLMAMLVSPINIFAQNELLSHRINILKKYDQDHLHRIAMPIGGIGTGTVSLGGSGDLKDWEIMNVPAKGYSTVTTGNDAPFFAIYTKKKMRLPDQKLF